MLGRWRWWEEGRGQEGGGWDEDGGEGYRVMAHWESPAGPTGQEAEEGRVLSDGRHKCTEECNWHYSSPVIAASMFTLLFMKNILGM